jgi:hypothetical protein
MRPQITRYRDRSPLTNALYAFLGLALAAFLLWIITAALAGATVLADPLGWLSTLDERGALDAVSNSAEVVAAVLGIAITVVAIVVELAATRFSHLITRLFMREPVNMIVLGLFVITTIQCVWIGISLNHEAAGAVLPHAGFFITFALVTLSLLCLLPYIYFVFTFLSPISVIERICRNAVSAIGDGIRADVPTAQRMTLAAIDELQDVSRGAIEQGDRSIAISGINGMTAVLYDYAEMRDQLPAEWFRLTDAIAQDPDFIALTEDALAEVEENRLWLETKIMRQLNALMFQSAGVARDVANLIGINTGQMAKDLGVANPELLALCVKSFNSFLRTTINARDVRTAYYLMDRYREVAEHLLDRGEGEQAFEIAGFFSEYGQLGHLNGISFLIDAAAYDVVRLIEHALERDSDQVDPLLEVLLDLDEEIREEKQEDSLLGVRRSQIQLATLFLERGEQARVARIVADLKGERGSRLQRLRQQLESEDRPQYWELIDRGTNFRYLPPERRRYLEPLYAQLLG